MKQLTFPMSNGNFISSLTFLLSRVSWTSFHVMKDRSNSLKQHSIPLYTVVVAYVIKLIARYFRVGLV